MAMAIPLSHIARLLPPKTAAARLTEATTASIIAKTQSANEILALTRALSPASAINLRPVRSSVSRTGTPRRASS